MAKVGESDDAFGGPGDAAAVIGGFRRQLPGAN
jgi:hypothetical protein